MKNKIIKNTIGAFVFAVILTLTAIIAPAQDRKDTIDQKKEGREEVQDATKVFKEIMSKPDKAIPRELLENATAIGIFPNVVKAAFLVGGRGGDGIVIRRDAAGNWTLPVFYNVGGASFGAQIGAKSTDYIMLFMNEGALQNLEDDKLELGGDIGFAAGPIGRTLGAGTNPSLNSGILTYSRSAGAFIGASLNGAVLTADNSINNAFYGKNGGDVLKNPAGVSVSPMPSEFKVLTDALASYSGTTTKNKTSMMPNDDSRVNNTAMNDSRKNDPANEKFNAARRFIFKDEHEPRR